VEDLVSITAAIVSALGSGVAGVIAAWLQSRRREGPEVKASLEERLSELGDNLRDSARLLTEVEAEIEARAARAERLKREADDAERLAALAASERDAVARLVRAEIGAEGRRSLRRGLLINLLFFVAGILASIAVTLLVHPL
jgi:uncharacterized protein YicC (UPF0701 family)